MVLAQHMFPIWPRTSISVEHEEACGENRTAETHFILILPPGLFRLPLFGMTNNVASAARDWNAVLFCCYEQRYQKKGFKNWLLAKKNANGQFSHTQSAFTEYLVSTIGIINNQSVPLLQVHNIYITFKQITTITTTSSFSCYGIC